MLVLPAKPREKRLDPLDGIPLGTRNQKELTVLPHHLRPNGRLQRTVDVGQHPAGEGAVGEGEFVQQGVVVTASAA